MTKGQCAVSVAALLKEPNYNSEMFSQLLFGETFEIESHENGFSKIVSDFDGVVGWMSDLQYTLIQDIVETNLIQDPVVKYSDQLLSLGSELNFEFSHKNTEESTVLSTARRFLNVPFLHGGRSLFGVDASAFVQLVYKVHGKKLPRFAEVQAELGELLAFVWEAEAGDLAFFDDESGRISHVGIMLNNEEIIHAYGKVRVDILDSSGIFNKDLQKHTHQLRFIKRLS